MITRSCSSFSRCLSQTVCGSYGHMGPFMCSLNPFNNDKICWPPKKMYINKIWLLLQGCLILMTRNMTWYEKSYQGTNPCCVYIYICLTCWSIHHLCISCMTVENVVATWINHKSASAYEIMNPIVQTQINYCSLAIE